MREILSDLVAEQQFLDQFLQRVAVRDWDKKTPLRRWTIRDTISHLADSEERTAGILEGTADLDVFEGDLDAIRAGAITLGRKMRPQDVIEWWRGGRAKVVEPLSHMTPAERVGWVTGSVSARTIATIRLAETWSHGLDIYSAMGAEIEDTARIRHVCWLGWRSLPYKFKIAGLDYTPVRVEVIGPGYSKWIYGPEDATNIVKGSAADWARLVVHRVGIADTRLKATGEGAETALTVARAYI